MSLSFDGHHFTILMSLLHLPAKQKRIILLLSVGTLLEWFDLFLYAHMAFILNNLFFPPTDSNMQSLLAAFAFSTSFIFRPLGALLFGYIGDKYGRKITVVVTTFMMAITCLTMAMAPTYDQVGITASWIITTCRILQGMTSLGEVTAAQLFLTESTPLPARFTVVGLINVAITLGALFAVAVGVLSTSIGFNWRIAFMVGSCIAVIGMLVRTTLRESLEFADASRRLRNNFKQLGQDPQSLQQNFLLKKNVNPKTALAYFGIMCSSQIFLYFVYFYSPAILKSAFHYTNHQVLIHNFFLIVIEIIGFSMLRTYLTTIMHPLKILRYNWIALFTFSLFIPWLLNHVTAVWHLFFIQVLVILFRVHDFPAVPIFYRSFPVFKRFTAASLLYALAYALAYVATSFGLTYLIQYFGYWGLLVLMVPSLIGYGFGLHYFIKLEREANRYPVLRMWDIKESIRKEWDEFFVTKISNS